MRRMRELSLGSEVSIAGGEMSGKILSAPSDPNALLTTAGFSPNVIVNAYVLHLC